MTATEHAQQVLSWAKDLRALRSDCHMLENMLLHASGNEHVIQAQTHKLKTLMGEYLA
jgi:hypothetical protein